MSITKLDRARTYEAIYSANIRTDERPLFHLTPRVGWLNDPNGFSVYRGEYHLFYQYHPYNTNWGPMHWGHCKSRDLLHWEYLPAALAPDMPYDNAGCFSGSAIELPDGRQMLLYTGWQERQRDDGRMDKRQTQCLAYGDGIDYQKYDDNPVMSASALPEGSSEEDFRDPKLWFEDGRWYAVATNRTADGSGSVVLFESEDTCHWRFVSVLERSANEYGKMWECPDFFELDGTHLLIVSPMEMPARGLEFHNGNGTIYIVGDYDKETKTFSRREVHSVDYGLDFYAPQSTLTLDGRRVLIGWMQSPHSVFCQPNGNKWFGMMTIPRELSMRDGRLIQTPIRELENCRTRFVGNHNIFVRERIQLPRVSGRTIDMTVTLRPSGGALYDHFEMKLARDEQFYTEVTYCPGESVLKFDRSHSGFCHDILHTREVAVRNRNGAIKLRVILDRFSVEIFINDGEQVLSSTIYTPLRADAISFEASGGVLMDVEKYDIQMECQA